jgi:H+-transporting ATPase
MAGLAAKWKEPARDALDTLVLTSVDLPSLDAYEQVGCLPFDANSQDADCAAWRLMP